MIRVTVELVPGGDASRAQIIGRADIENLGVSQVRGGGRCTLYDYAAVVRLGAVEARTRLVAIGDHRSVWVLVRRVLEQLGDYSPVMDRN